MTMEFCGHLRLRADAGGNGRTRLAEQAFQAPFHVSKPYWNDDASTLLVQVVNPTAGILSGDRLESEVRVDSGGALLLTTPSASRIFCMREGKARSRQRFHVARGGWLEVWSEPIVPHGGSVYEQTTELVVEQGGSAFFVDTLLTGRVAHGESCAWRRLVVQLQVWHGGMLALHERFDQSGEEYRALMQMAAGSPAPCVGNAVLILPEKSGADLGWRARVHDLQTGDTRIGVSPLRSPGAWSIKFIASDGDRARSLIRRIRAVLTEVAPRLRCDPRKL